VHSGFRFVLWWVGSAALWLVLAATLARPDVIAAVFAGLIVAADGRDHPFQVLRSQLSGTRIK